MTTAALGRASASAVTEQASADDYVLWFNEPATLWQEHAFPVGNGSTGAMIYGSVDSEQIQFNHDTLWNGGPGSVDDGHEYNFGNWYEKRPTALAEVRAEIAATGSADTQASMVKLGQTKWGYGAYQTFGDLFLDRATPAGEVTGYRRQLDMATGLTSVRFTTADGVTHTRELFASFPDRVIVTRVTASKPHQVSFTARFATADNRYVLGPRRPHHHAWCAGAQRHAVRGAGAGDRRRRPGHHGSGGHGDGDRRVLGDARPGAGDRLRAGVPALPRSGPA
jgi:alpha-L-fucosidase 2